MEMKYETLRRWHRPETATEKAALRQVAEKCGDWPECQQCRREVASCQLLSDEYDSIVWRAQGE
jgi:hypothetical protein